MLGYWRIVVVICAAVIAVMAMGPTLVATTGRRGLTVLCALSVSAVLTVAAMLLTRQPPVQDTAWPVDASLGAAAGVLGVQVTIDIWVRRLPLRPSVTTAAIVMLSLLIGSGTSRWWPALAGAAAMTMVSVALRTLSRGQLGRGDVYLSPLLGAIIGMVNPWAVLTAWVATAILAALFALAVMAIGLARRTTLIAYGPFMVAGTVIAVWATVNGQ